MILDSKGKLFGKISIIDIFIIIVIIAGAAGLFYKAQTSKTLSPLTKSDSIQTVFYCTEIPDYVANSIKEGDIVTDAVLNSYFGTVASVAIDASKSYVSTEKGEILVVAKPGFLSLKVTSSGKGIYSNSGVTFDNTDYYIGKTLTVKVGNTIIYANISSIKK